MQHVITMYVAHVVWFAWVGRVGQLLPVHPTQSEQVAARTGTCTYDLSTPLPLWRHKVSNLHVVGFRCQFSQSTIEGLAGHASAKVSGH